MSLDLFSSQPNRELMPLAERVRPRDISQISGQQHLLSAHSALFKLLAKNQLLNLIFWGPPGTGKTTLALSIARQTKADWIQINAVDSGVKDLKEAGLRGQKNRLEQNRQTILFVDEIHRFSKSQQDVLLPFIEKGDLYLIGATTEFPSYELNKALLSRCQVIEFKRLQPDDLKNVMLNSLKQENVEVEKILTIESLEKMIEFADGDARKILNYLDTIIKYYKLNDEEVLSQFPLAVIDLENLFGRKFITYDKKSDQHYDCVSAFIKSMRGSDPDAALYYAARMLEGGEDPVFIARRMIIFASEDIGNAEPRALPLAMSVLQAIEAIGMPEARINLGQGITFLASCPKSNSSYKAINQAIDYVRRTGTVEVPQILRSSQKGQGYLSPHDHPKHFVEQNYWPEVLPREKFYDITDSGKKPLGFEKTLAEYLRWMKRSE
jgi:putative ATPase